MGEAYRGLTIQFKADGTKVMSTLKSMTRAASQVESELRMVKKGLRFDGASAKLAASQLNLLAERAGASRGALTLMRREYAKLGDVRFNGVPMRELSARTKDAATQAEIMRTRYASVTNELGVLHNQFNNLWASSKKLKHLSNPLKDSEAWGSTSTEEIQSYIAFLERMGAVTAKESMRMRTAVAGLRSEFNYTLAELKKLDSIAEYQSFGNKVAQQAAKVKAEMKELNAAAKAFRPTGFEEKLDESRASVKRLESQVQKLKAAMRLDPSSFSLVAQHAEAIRANMVALEGETKDLRAEMRMLGADKGVVAAASDAKKLEENLRGARSEVDHLGDELAQAKAVLNVLSDEVKDLKRAEAAAATEDERLFNKQEIITKNAQIKEQERLVDQLAASYGRAENQVQMYNRAVRFNEGKSMIASNEAMLASMQQQTTKRMKLLSSSAATALGMTMYSTLYPAVMMAGTYAIQAAEDVDAAYRNMRKTVQGTDEEFVQLKKDALAFGDTHYTSADQLLQIEAIGGQLGITVDNLEAFSKTIANLNIATNISDPEELATQFGKMASVMGLTSEEYDKFADSLVRLGNSEPAMESDILNMATRFMGMGKVVGMSSDEMLAWATTAVATGQKAEAAGSSMLRMTGRFEAAVAGVSDGMMNLEELTDEDREAFEAAKDKLQGYADVAGMTAEKFADLWKKSPSKALQAFVEGLHDMSKNGESAVQALKDLGINNVRDQQLFLGLANTTDVLSDSLTMSRNAWNGQSDQWGDAGDAAREADKKCQGFSGALQTLKNNGQHIASIMGESLTPTLRSLTDLLAGLVGAFAGLDPGMQQAITLSILGSASMGPLLTAYGAMSNAVKSAKASWKEYTTAGNKVARMESSHFMRMTGLSDKYKKYAKDVDKAKATIERCNAAANKPGTVMNPKAMSQVNSGWREANATLSKTQMKMSALTKLQAAGSLFGSVGSMAAVGAIMVGLEQLGSYLYDVHQKSEAYKKSTEGLASASEKLRNVSMNAGRSIEQQAAAMSSAGYQQGMYYSRLQDVINANAQLADSIDQRLNKALDDSTMAEFYAGRIADLAGNCEGSASKIAELQACIEEYNQLTGSSISIVDDFTGAVNMSADALEKQKEAFIQNALLEAYSGSLKEAAKALANTEAEISKIERELGTTYDEAAALGVDKEGFLELVNYANSLEAGSDEQQQFIKSLEATSPELVNLINKSQELVQTLSELEKQKEADEQATQDSTKALEKQLQVTSEAEKAAKQAEKAFGSIKSFNQALASNNIQDDIKFQEMANELGYFDEDVKQFGKDLASVGVDAAQLGQIGTTAFMDLWNRALEAGGGLEEVAKAVTLVNATGIDPKTVTIEDGQLKIAMAELSEFDREQLEKKGYEVSDDGTITVAVEEVDFLKQDLAELDAVHATPTASLKDEVSNKVKEAKDKVLGLASTVGKATMSSEVKTTYTADTSRADSRLASLNKAADDATKERQLNVEALTDGAMSALRTLIDTSIPAKYIDVYVRQHGEIPSGGQAAGGINDTPLYRIPAYASGAALNGIVTKPTLTNRGLVGEAGNEALLRMGGSTAVVPLSNRRYVRPFARAVASEMGGKGSSQVVNNYYSVNGMTLAPGSDGARALEALYDAIRLEEAV